MADETIETVNEQWNPEWDMTESEIYIRENGYFAYILACANAYLNEGVEFVQSYGWFILIGGIILYYLYNKYKNQITMPRTPLHRDVDENAELDRLQKIEAVRQRQQAAMDAAAAKYREEKRLKEIEAVKKKEEEWERHQQGLGYRSKTKKTNNDEDLASMGLTKKNETTKPKLRDSDYNPLTGQSSSERPRANFCRPKSNRGG